MAENMDVQGRSLSPPNTNKRGQVVHKRERIVIVNLYKDLKVENPRITKREAHAILSRRTGFGIFSIKNTLLQYENTGRVTSPNQKKRRMSRNHLVDELDRNTIRKKVHEFYLKKEFPTLKEVLHAVNEDEDLPNFKRTTFWKLLSELNFTYVSRRHNSILIERDDIILWRRNYLKAIRKFRKEGRPIYYLDETWVNVGDVSSKVKNTSLRGLSISSDPSGKGKRLIVLNVGSSIGFVPNGLSCFESKKCTAVYHDEMNGDTFLEWFERVLPSLADNAVIVMDDAPCHSVKLEKSPDSSWKKIEIIEWLKSKGQVADMSMLKPELLQIVSLIKDNSNKYVTDEKAKEHNKTVLRLPPYHCELNPIGMAWSMVKDHVKSHKTEFEIDDVKRLLKEGVERVTTEHWGNFVRHVIEAETKLWESDQIADRMIDDMQPLFIDVNADIDSDDESSD
ncbi:uncharacterized protein LOC124179902 [Neodiprion fabricii]|uniref:uncharacterized protein LOC124179902 n=1 Tax=Neodiprion fabricii TaxID=2872261 RepID=UPI001ED97D5E|nr:uncharacterized protein LOC124179902 [Neodiprion fabricii]